MNRIKQCPCCGGPDRLKILKLKRLLLLVDPVVSSIKVSDMQLKQWDEFVKCYPEEGTHKNLFETMTTPMKEKY